MMNPLDLLPPDPKMAVIAVLLLTLFAATVLLLAAVALRSLISGEPPAR